MKKHFILAGLFAVGLAGFIGGTLIEGTQASATTMVKQEQPARQFGIYFYYVDEQGKEISADDCVTLDEGDSYDIHRDIREIEGYRYIGLFDEKGNKVTKNIQGQANQNLKYYYRYAKKCRVEFHYVDEKGKEFDYYPFDSFDLLRGRSYHLSLTTLDIKGYEYQGLYDEDGNMVADWKSTSIEITINRDLKYYYRYHPLMSQKNEF